MSSNLEHKAQSIVDTQNAATGDALFDSALRSGESVSLTPGQTATQTGTWVDWQILHSKLNDIWDVVGGVRTVALNKWRNILEEKGPEERLFLARVQRLVDPMQLPVPTTHGWVLAPGTGETHGWILATGTGETLDVYCTDATMHSRSIMDFYQKALVGVGQQVSEVHALKNPPHHPTLHTQQALDAIDAWKSQGTTDDSLEARAAKLLLFTSELTESCETLSEYPARTLSDVIYLQSAIFTNQFISAWPDSGILTVLKGLPSAPVWLEHCQELDAHSNVLKEAKYESYRAPSATAEPVPAG